MGVETYFALAICAALAVGAVMVIHGTVVKNRWGVNFHRVHCPNCGTVMGFVRVPNSGRQAMWGGYTCPSCKSELDKWGRQIAA